MEVYSGILIFGSTQKVGGGVPVGESLSKGYRMLAYEGTPSFWNYPCRIAQIVSAAVGFSWFHMGGCQNYGPFLGTLNRIQKGTIILTTTRIVFLGGPQHLSGVRAD